MRPNNVALRVTMRTDVMKGVALTFEDIRKLKVSSERCDVMTFL